MNSATDTLQRLAVDLDANPGTAVDATTTAWLTDVARDCVGTDALVAIINDASESVAVRARAMSMLTAQLLRG